MNRFLMRLKQNYVNELPLIKLYGILYLAGAFLGCAAAFLLRDDFSDQARLLFQPENSASFISALLQQIFCFALLFSLGLTVVGIGLLPFYPLYKGFSIGLLLSLATLFFGLRGMLIGIPAFFIHCCFYSACGYFICCSSARLSISLSSLLRGRCKHAAAYNELRRHFVTFLITIPFLMAGGLWESKVVPLILHLF